MAENIKVCIIGAEGWGSAIAAAVSKNVRQGIFDSRVHIYVFDELVRSSPLSEVINDSHENVKYLPGIKLPKNLVAVNDLLEAAQNADILIFSMPQSLVDSCCNILEGNLKETAIAVSMIKGLMEPCDDDVVLVSHAISERLGIPCYSMMSPHNALDVAQGKPCEITLGCSNPDHGELLIAALETKNCKVISIDDVDGVELCGTLKDIIALGVGFVDGLHLGDSACVAATHLGLNEMMHFMKDYFPSAKMSTVYQTCGVASTSVDQNMTIAKNLISSGQTIQEVERNLHGGRKLQGPLVVSEVNAILETDGNQHKFPLITAIHKICQNEAPPELILDVLRNHPDLRNSSVLDLLNEETDEKMSSEVLDEVADTLPKLRTALDKILSEAGDKSFKHLKVVGSWSPKIQKLKEPIEHQVPIETEDIPDSLSAKASQIQEEIRDGNVKVAFTMDVEDKGRQMRLLLKEAPNSSTSMGQSVVLPGVASGKGKEMTRMGKSVQMDSSLRSMDMDALDLSTEPKKPTPDPWLQEIKLIDETIQLMQNASSHSDHSELLELKMQNTNEENVQAQDNLIKSIKNSLEVMDDKEVIDNLIGETEMVERNLIQEESQLHDSNESDWKMFKDEELQDRSPTAELDEQYESKFFLADEDYREKRQTRMELNEEQDAELRMELNENDPEMNKSKHFTESEPIGYLAERQPRMELSDDQEAEIRMELDEEDQEIEKSKYFTESEPIDVNYLEEWQDRKELYDEQEAELRLEYNEEDQEMKESKYFTESEPIDVNYPANADLEGQERAQFGDEDDLEQLEKKFQHTYTVSELQDSGWETLHDTEPFQISEVRQEGKPNLQDNLSSDLQLQGERKTPSKKLMEDWQDVEQSDCLRVRAKSMDSSPWSVDSYLKGFDEESSVDKSRYSDHLVRSDSHKPFKSKITEILEETAEDFQDSDAIRARDDLQERSSEDLELKARNTKLDLMDQHEDVFDRTDDEDMKTYWKTDDRNVTKMQSNSSDDHFDEDNYWKLKEFGNLRDMGYFEEGLDERLVESAEEKRSTKMGERRPLVSLEEVNMRYYSDQKDGEGSHEWDWLLNNEKIGKDESEPRKYEETLSRADEENLEKLNDKLTQALKQQKAKAGDDSLQGNYSKIFKDAGSESKSLEDLAEVSAYDSKNTLGDEQDTEATKKRIPREFAVPAPGATPAFIPRETRKPQRKPKIQEGTPHVQIEPRTAPSQQPHIRPHEVEFGQEQREVKKEEAAAKPPKPPAKEQAPARRPPGERVHKREQIPQPDKRSPERKRPQADQLAFKKRRAPESGLDRAERKMNSIMRQGKDRQVNYSGKNPFNKTTDKPVDTDPKQKQGRDDGRRRVVISPPFNPPINPRVRVPRPPFDGRDKEYHTLTSTLTTSSLVPIMRRRPMLKKNALRGPIVSSAQLKQLSVIPRPVQAIRRPSLQMPPGMPRSPAFTKILCALQIGFLASYLARFRKQR
ncbi:uncharacterized protein Dana_GF18443 [Drosophila ananassae]|uniref:Glycerol-3-phosphate dehydrogenase [NAD(+)] n=1 Tax=Drosophila ananassae TaxID=7217 RepID=B3M218_DROAN|nr:uncharacterized protein Dana_GF18443 [Drosophila ananassae]